MKLKTPSGLSPAAAEWWRRLLDQYEDWTADSLITLEAGLQAFDRWQAARELVDKEGLTVSDRFGQVKPHPLCGLERDSRAACLAAFARLNLDAPEQLSASAAARRAAMARWHRRGAA